MLFSITAKGILRHFKYAAKVRNSESQLKMAHVTFKVKQALQPVIHRAKETKQIVFCRQSFVRLVDFSTFSNELTELLRCSTRKRSNKRHSIQI